MRMPKLILASYNPDWGCPTGSFMVACIDILLQNDILDPSEKPEL
jgi:hypothetical protein